MLYRTSKHLTRPIILYGKYYYFFLFIGEEVRHREFNKLAKADIGNK